MLDLKNGHVSLSHGSGGRAMNELIDELFISAFDNNLIREKADNARFAVEAGHMVVATDSHVISPLFFPGGDIGSLSIHGTINDIAMSGATPRYLTSSFILEEGFPLNDLQRIVHSMAQAARAANVEIITGDTKVVEKGKGDGVFINTTGIGSLAAGVQLSPDQIQAGDKIIVSGSMGDHGMTILSLREDLEFQTDLQSDSAVLHELVATMLQVVPEGIHCLRDPTRGGLSATLNELAQQSTKGMCIKETAIPVNPAVRSACELLGLDPLHVANEGKLVAFCAPEQADVLVKHMRAHPLGAEAAIIGEVLTGEDQFVELETAFGGKRLLDWASGELLPRIC